MMKITLSDSEFRELLIVLSNSRTMHGNLKAGTLYKEIQTQLGWN